MKESKQMDRRSFLKFTGMAGLASALPFVSPSIGLASLGGGLKVAQETRIMLGTLVGVTVVDKSADKAQLGLAKAFEAMSAISPYL
jgi:thiamine biosynthesis lipoprotein